MLIFEIIPHGSPQYLEAVALRDLVLRQPLGLHFTPEQLAAEATEVHICAYHKGELVACLSLVPEPESKIKMRQVAVSSQQQQSGIGKQLVQFAELWAKQNNYTCIHCHARDAAVPFYLKLGYYTIGDEFIEVNIPHRYMEKKL